MGASAPGYRRFSPFRLTAGAWPTGPGEVVIDAETAASQHFGVGDRIGVITNGGRERRFRVTGIAGYGSSASLAGDTLAIFDLPTAQRLFGEPGKLDQIDVAARPGVGSAALVRQIRAVLPRHTQVRTSAQQARSTFNDYDSAITILRDFLLAFGGVALFVGAFVIANTLSITVAQRAREFATLRTLGATARQVRASVLLEGLVTGLVASAVGLFAGLALARALEALFRAGGLKLPLAGPRLRDAHGDPLARRRHGGDARREPGAGAARDAGAPRSRPSARDRCCRPRGSRASGRRSPSASARPRLRSACAGAFVSALATGPRLLLLGAGVLALFVGIAMAAPSIARPLARVLGWPATRIGGAAGRLARANAMRSPARTASTAAALMIGLALVTAFAVFGQGLKQSIVGAVTAEFRGDYVLTSQNGFVPTSVASTAALRRAGIASVVAGERSGDGRVLGQTSGRGRARARPLTPPEAELEGRQRPRHGNARPARRDPRLGLCERPPPGRRRRPSAWRRRPARRSTSWSPRSTRRPRPETRSAPSRSRPARSTRTIATRRTCSR